MADRRPALRFRLPWLPAGQPQRPTSTPWPPTQPPTATATPPTGPPQTAATQVPNQPAIATTTTTSTIPQTVEPQLTPQPSSITVETDVISQSTIAAIPTPTTVPQTAENPTQPTPATTTPIPTAESPPFRPPGLAPPQSPPPQASLQPQTDRTEMQPSSPSRAIVQPIVPSQPASPARAVTQSQATPQPSTPTRVAPETRVVSLPSTPSRRSPQLPSAPRTATQPGSPSLRPENKTSLPSKTTAQVQTTAETVNQPKSPLKGEQSPTNESYQPSEKSNEVLAYVPDKQEPKSAESKSQTLDFQPKAKTKSGAVYDSQDGSGTTLETKQPESEIKEAETYASTEESEAPAITHISKNSNIYPEAESFPPELKQEETKEVQEAMTGTKDMAHDKAMHKDANLTEELGSTQQTKGQPDIAFQSEKTQKTVSRKDIMSMAASNGRQTKVAVDQSRNKNTVVDNRQKLPTSNGEHNPLHKEIREDISKLVNKMTIGDSKLSMDDRPVSVVTLTDENRGATMHLGYNSSQRGGAINIHRGYKIKPDGKATVDGDEKFKGNSNNLKTKEDQASEAYVNSNVQGINNSILFNCSITERNPGVHLIRPSFPTESKTSLEKSELLETRKAEFTMTPSQKLTHEPNVRRRCLRGLFLESSDSDLDSTKPRSHGCRVGCNEKRKEHNADVL